MSSIIGVEDVEHGSKESDIHRDVELTSENQALPETIETFQHLQNELQQFLSHHITQLNSMRDSLTARTKPLGHGSPASSSHNSLSAEALCDYPPQMQPKDKVEDFRLSPGINAHKASLSSFLEIHAENLRNLQKALSQTNSQAEIEDTQTHAISKKQYSALSDQFSMLVVISTFTAALIIAFLSLVNDIIGPEHRVPFSLGMLLSFLAMAVHFGTIIVAGRGAALTSQHQAGEEVIHDLAYFRLYLGLCEQLQFFATILFLVSIVILSFFIFTNLAFPLVLLAISILGSLFVFWSVYWRVSITFRNLKLLLGGIRKLRERRNRR